MKVLLIGATGFVGSAIRRELVSRGHQVTAVMRGAANIDPNPLVKAVDADATNPEVLASLAAGHDAVISAYNPGWKNPRQYEETLENYPKIVEGVRKSGVKRLLIVGGAGTLFVKPGLRQLWLGWQRGQRRERRVCRCHYRCARQFHRL